MNYTIAISQRVDLWSDRGEQRDALDQRLCLWMLAAGCLPVPVPNAWGKPDDLQIWLHTIKPQGVFLSGGNDIGHITERDSTECCLLDYARDHLLPVLGICRGMQLMSVWAGGCLRTVEGHVRTRHRLQCLDGLLPREVNSFHNMALEECPPGFEVTGRSEDGIIEAFRHQSLPWEGWMWHPEREEPFSQIELARYQYLLATREAH